MKALIFAAGRGQRMRPLTDTCPKPLLKVRGRPLIVWHVLNLVRAGITEIVINHSHLGRQIEQALGDGGQFGASIAYSPEPVALETAGAIANARHLLGDQPFLAVSGDIHCPYFDFGQVKDTLPDADLWGNRLPPGQRDMCWIYLVKNPFHHPQGDFGIDLYSIRNQGAPLYTFANIGLYRPEMFDAIAPGQHAQLGPLIRQYADLGQVGGELYGGDWTNVGTVEQLAALNAPFARSGTAGNPA
jgi:N-acetyl-alpha-D-muramate 1-phosphate uridylyltransferase